jgi:hypothetical protein
MLLAVCSSSEHRVKSGTRVEYCLDLRALQVHSKLELAEFTCGVAQDRGAERGVGVVTGHASVCGAAVI